MPKTTIDIAGVGLVYITKKRGQRNMRLRVDRNGEVQVSLPWLAPKQMAAAFVLSKLDWIKQQQKNSSFVPYDGMLLGKTLKLQIIENSQKTRASQKGKVITVHFAKEYLHTNKAHVESVKRAIIKALRIEAESVLLPRLRELAQVYGFEYSSSAIKQVTARWGSCDSKKHITFSIYLIQLPIEYIDYVIIHELAHTRHMNHGKSFWRLVEEYCPDYRIIRKKMRGLSPRIYDAKTFMS